MYISYVAKARLFTAVFSHLSACLHEIVNCSCHLMEEAIKPVTEQNGTEPEVIVAQYGRGH